MIEGNILDKILSQTSKSKKPTKKQQKIAEMTIKIFAEKGYANTSTSEIAKASGVAEGTIFRHYGTKDNLLLAVLLPFIKELLPSIAQGMMHEFSLDKFETFESFLRAVVHNRMNFLKENREVFKILVKELLYRDELRKEFLSYVDKDIFVFVRHIIDTFKEKGEIKNLPTPVIMKMLGTFLGGYFTTRFIFLFEGDVEEEELDYIVGFILDGVRGEAKI